MVTLLSQKLINELDLIPEDWSLVPVKEKRPYRRSWQTEPTMPRDELKRIIETGDRQWSDRKQKFWTAYPEGYGIRTGEWSGGKLAIDVDGPTAEILLQAISLGEIPTTVAWTSGKTGREQLIYQLSEPLQARLKTVSFTHVAIKELGEFRTEGDEQLDFRYDRCQSVLPPSKHPTTGSYRWINSPENTEVAAAPQWLEDWLNQHCDRLEQAEQERTRKQAEAEKRRASFQAQFPDSEEISPLTLLNAINPEFLDWYEWRNCLLAAKHEELLESEVRSWSSQSTKHTDRGFDDVWNHIKNSGPRLVTGGTLWYFASQQGWTLPERQQRQEWQRQRENRLALERLQLAKAMPAIERDRGYRDLLAQLTLHPDDRADLHRRGFTDEQIEEAGFKSVERWQRFDFELPANLPGVSLDGRSLNISKPGYLCPIRDVDGLIVGMQIRLRNGKRGRYRWLTSATEKRPNGPTSHLPNSELPLAVHRPNRVRRAAIALVEGVGAKPFILSQRLGMVTIGAAGAQFASSPETLKHSLEVIATELGTRTVELYADAGAVQNSGVMNQYRRTWKLSQQWGYEVQIAWWGQEAKDDSDIDELKVEDLGQIQYLTVPQFEHLAKELNGTGQDSKKQITSKLSRLIGLRSAAVLERKLARSTETPGRTLDDAANGDVFEYQEGERLATWQKAVGQGYRFILDQSGTGTGKSYDSGNVTPDLFGEDVRQILYISDQHRNPTTETLSEANGWTDLEARHGGLVEEETPNGGSRLKRAGKGDIPTVPGNCSRTKLAGAFRDKNIQGSDTASLICGICPLREACSHSQGPNYGFLNRRHLALSAPKLRSHPESRPDPREYDCSGVVQIHDEPGQNFVVKRDVVVDLRDLEQTISALLPYPELLGRVQDIATTLLPYLKGEEKTGKYGLSHPEVLTALQKHLPEDLEVSQIERVLHPDLSFLNTTAEYGTDLADLPPSLRKKFSERDAEVAEKVSQQILKQWLPDLLRVLQGSQGTLHISRQQLTISLPDRRHQEIAKATKANVFLDATLSREALAQKLDCQPDEIFVCKQAVPTTHSLSITQITDLGRLGMERGKDQKHRVAAIVSHYQGADPTAKVIDFKKFTTEGAWWRDSRGVNDFLKVNTLILVGTPCRNLADLQAEYAILTGTYPSEDDHQFQAFVDREILADFHQAIGRLRAHRRPEEKLEIVVVSNFDLGLPNVNQIKASDITPEAADKTERLILTAQKALKQIKEAGEKVTQQAIAKLVGCTQARISQLWRFINSAIDSFNSRIYNSGSPPDSSVVEITEAAIEACETVEQLQESVSEIFFDWLKPHQWGYLWKQLSNNAQNRILEAILLALPSDVLEAAT